MSVSRAIRTLLPVSPTEVQAASDSGIWQSRPLRIKWQDWIALAGRINSSSRMPPVAAFHCNQHHFWASLILRRIVVAENPCRLNWSVQHYLEVYLPEFESPKFVAGVD
jgi:hypothetical protein